MARLQHFGWFFSRGFGPQGWRRPYQAWNYDWTEPALYQQSAQALEQAGIDLVIVEDALSLGNPDTLDLRVRGAYGGPKLDPLLLAPYLFAATSRIGITPTINPLSVPPYTAARQIATLAHLSDNRFGVNVVTDDGSSRHFGADPVPHDVAYDRAGEWTGLLRRLWHSWPEGALIADPSTGRFADGTRMDAFEHHGEHYDVTGPLNALPLDADPVIVSPGSSPRGLAFAGTHSDVQLAAAPLDPESIGAYRAKVHAAARVQGRKPGDIRILFVFAPEVAPTAEYADAIVAASRAPGDAELVAIAAAQSSDLETDLTALDLDKPIPEGTFADHVSQGSIKRLLGTVPTPADATLRELLTAKARKGRITDGTGTVGTAAEIADFVELLGDEADNDGFILNGDLHPVTIHRTLDDLVPTLRHRGLLRDGLSAGGLRANLFEF